MAECCEFPSGHPDHPKAMPYVKRNICQPGGGTGWHTQPGHNLIVVTAADHGCIREKINRSADPTGG
jgi:hypothetical protein